MINHALAFFHLVQNLSSLIGGHDETEVIMMKSSQRGRKLLQESKRLQQRDQSPLAIVQVREFRLV